jgi:dolichyl-phosphate beta-glucosyltransferase
MSEGEMSKVTIVVPCYNEFDRLSVDEFKDYALRGTGHRFLFVDDGSTDSTGELLEDLHAFDGQAFRALRLAQNLGKAEAVRQGFLAALDERPNYIAYWDADLATPLGAISEFCRALDDSPDLEIVLGARVILLGHDVERRLIRHYLGRLAATAASLAVGIRVYDAMCGAKCFRVTRRTAALFARPFRSRWVFDAEWLARFVNCGDRPRGSTSLLLWELPLRQWREMPGSKLRCRDFARAALDLAAIFLRYRCGALSDGQVDHVHPVLARREKGTGSTDESESDIYPAANSVPACPDVEPSPLTTSVITRGP